MVCRVRSRRRAGTVSTRTTKENVHAVYKVSTQSVKRLQEELSRLLSELALNRSGCDWDAALESHKHRADKQTCDFSLWNIWRFLRREKKNDLHICLLTDACRDCLFEPHQTLSLSLPLCLISVRLVLLTLSHSHILPQYARVYSPWRFWAELTFHSQSFLRSSPVRLARLPPVVTRELCRRRGQSELKSGG